MNVRNQKQNFGKKCLQWALYANSEDINVHVRKFGFQNTKPWLLDAILNWSKEFEEKFPNSYNIRFNIADKVWEATSNGEDQVEQIASVEQTVEQMKKSIVWDKKVKGRLIFGIIFAILGVVLLILHSNTPVTICGIVALVISLILLIMWLVRFLNGDKRYKAILNASLDTIKGCMSELTEYRRIYLNNVNKKGELFSLIEHL